MVDRSEQLRVRSCANAMLALEVGRRLMGLLRCGLFLRRGSCRDTAGSTVVTNVVDSDVVYHCLRVDVADLRTSYVVDGAVVEKIISAPVSTFIPTSVVTVAVVDPTIKADVATPVPRVSHV